MTKSIPMLFIAALTGCSLVLTRQDDVRRGWLPVGDGHELYFEDAGPRDAIAAVYVHGGPGSGSNPKVRALFDLKRYRVITFDQRGTGRSRFADPLRENTTDHLLKDFEALRLHLGLEAWTVVGGSWGATLAISYAERHPERVRNLIVWGIFLGTRAELPWLRPDSKSKRWASFARGSVDPAADDHRRMEDPGTSDVERAQIALRWRAYETSVKNGDAPDEALKIGGAMSSSELVRATRIKLAYLAHDSYIRGDAFREFGRLREVPGVIIQGSADAVCPADGAAARLRAAWPKARYVNVPGGGHSTSDPKIARALAEALDHSLTP